MDRLTPAAGTEAVDINAKKTFFKVFFILVRVFKNMFLNIVKTFLQRNSETLVQM